MTFVHVKVALDKIADGQTLEVHLNAGEPMQNVPRSLKGEGHKVNSVTQLDDGTYILTVIKGGLNT
jgi:TusA-related sulfurtransferase